MKVLMIGGRLEAMRHDIMINLSSGSIRSIHTTGQFRVVINEDSEIWCAVVRTMSDTDRLRGMRFDFIVEHPSFPPDLDLLYTVQAIVLR